MASFTFDTLQQKHCSSIILCKYPSSLSPSSSSLNTLSFLCLSHFLTFSPPKHTPFCVLKAHVSNIRTKISIQNDQSPIKTITLGVRKENGPGFSSLRTGGERVERQLLNNIVGSVLDEKIDTKDKNTRKRLGYKKWRDFGSGNMSTRYKGATKERKYMDNQLISGRMEKKPRKGSDNKVKEEKSGKWSKRNKGDPQEVKFRLELDKCCKRGDVMAAIQLYDLAQREGIKMGQYHYTVLLYLCSSAAAGVVQPGKSGRGGRASNSLAVSDEVSSASVVEFRELRDKNDVDATESDTKILNNVNKVIDSGRNPGSKDKMELKSSNRFNDSDSTSNERKNLSQIPIVVSDSNYQQLECLSFPAKNNDGKYHDGNGILVSEDIKKYALERGFEIYEKMCMDKIPMNEATLTAVARIAMSMGNGDMAFDMVKQMKLLGLNPRLRSYGPALAAFCSSGDADKAFTVEKHMLDHGVHPEEPELEALLRVSVEAGKGDKVYYLLHKLRTSVRKVSPSTANIIIEWFKSKAASRVGKTKWDKRVVKEAIANGGGGWHGQGWLGKGKWTVSCSSVGVDAFCKSCGKKLATIDLDPTETESFAESVASIAIKREKDSSFQKFQKWLDYYGPFEAVVDGANVGLLGQKRFIPSKINAIANGIRQKLPSKKWPLIVLHNRRVTGHKMDEPVNKSLVEKWKHADALYATPTGSNDDWYWLYAAIKFKCLIVTNDEMRDHTFQLLGNDFFPKWKERHQVHFGFSDAGPVFHMPPSFSVVIQESENGHWHIPIASDTDYEPERAWLCITRAKLPLPRKDSITIKPEVGKLSCLQKLELKQSKAH
ncbi:proteinaceous RNase P 1, chloroplastic/mitochondrial isoform X2 [Ricinus communis]|uniref:proteinaceous RNase P 1, chloroplastic/mitochondrial isoform X2 n=1 Tax=Ricinus communis TaxID=3988 RepID=UPI000772183E|nr:proteinaceous RNase P 1, chloroplastic/mitochondrial isoform X2 [Ricinus communis]|eukprot:XP_015571702.1 proteinaceous RNase P 1, chloroplastic/mitochondrial isoform X2 [Ricinus communis]